MTGLVLIDFPYNKILMNFPISCTKIHFNDTDIHFVNSATNLCMTFNIKLIWSNNISAAVGIYNGLWATTDSKFFLHTHIIDFVLFYITNHEWTGNSY